MKLYEAMMEDCFFMEKVRTSDGLGGFTETWTQGAMFQAALHKDSSMQARVAEKQGVTELYTITVDRSVPLDFHDVIKRKSDGLILRVTSNIRDNKSPEFSGINFGQVTAEAWELT